MINLNKEDIEKISYLGYPKILELSMGKYLVKGISKEDGIKELIGPYFGKIMNLVVPENHLIFLNDTLYVLSEDLNNLGSFISASKKFNLAKEDITLLECWNLLEENEIYDSTEVFDIVKIYMFDILFKNTDRRLDNLGFIQNGKKEKVVMFDFDYILDDEWNTAFLHTSENDFKDATADFEVFLKESSEEYINLFMHYFNMFTPVYFEEVLDKLMKENNLEDEFVKDNLINEYSKNYLRIANLLERIKGRGR